MTIQDNNAPADMDLSACKVSGDGGKTSQTLAVWAKTTTDTAGEIASISETASKVQRQVDDIATGGDFPRKSEAFGPLGVMLLDSEGQCCGTLPNAGNSVILKQGYSIDPKTGISQPNPQVAQIQSLYSINAKVQMGHTFWTSDNTVAYESFIGNAFHPDKNNASNLGLPGLTWSNIFLANAPTVTSDANHKTIASTIQGDDEQHTKLLEAIYSVSTKLYQLNSAIQNKGADKARFHSGFIAQELQEALTKNGLDPSDYALWVQSPEYDYREVDTGRKDPVTGQPVMQQDYVLKKDQDGNQVYVQSLRYEEVFALLAEAFKKKLGDLETRLSALESQSK